MSRRDLEQARKERLKLLREIEGLLSFITDPVLVVDAEGKIVHTNSAAEQILERSQIIMIDKHVTEFVQSESLSKYIKQGKPVTNLAVNVINAKGARLDFSCRLHPLLVDAQVEGAILFFTKRALRQEQEKSLRYGTRFSLDDIIGSSPAIAALKNRL